MTRILYLITWLILSFDASSSSTNIECNFGAGELAHLTDMYTCYAYEDPNIISEESSQIISINGTHKRLKSDDDVVGFFGSGITIKHFPQDLDKFFKNLKMIYIASCQLQEIHQSDLKPFSNLAYICLYYNKIEIIEEGLFDYNPNLELIGIQESRIIHIHPNVFDHLDKLSYFWLTEVPCVDQSVSNSKERVKEVIKLVKSQCTNSEFLSLDEKFSDLENKLNGLNFDDLSIKSAKFEDFGTKVEDFSVKLENLEEILKNSKFSTFRPISYKLETLKTKILSARHQISLQNTAAVNLAETPTSPAPKNNELNFNVHKISKRAPDMFKDLFNEISKQGILPPPVHDPAASHNELKVLLNGINTQVSPITAIQATQNEIKNSQNAVSTKVMALATTQDALKISVSQIDVKINEIKTLQVNGNKDLNLKVNELKTLQTEVKGAITGVESKITSNTNLQNTQKLAIDALKVELKNSFNVLKATQDKLKVSQDSLTATIGSIATMTNDLVSSQNIIKDSISKVDAKANELKTLTTALKTSLGNIETQLKAQGSTLSGLQAIQKDTKTALTALKSSQDFLKNSQIYANNSLIEHVSGFSKLAATLTAKINDLTTSNAQLSALQNKTIKDLKLIQETAKTSQNNLKTSIDVVKSSQDDIKGSISDVEATISDLKRSQNELKDNLLKIKTSQNEVKILLNEKSSNKNDNFEDKFTAFGDKLAKLENLEGHFMDFKSENAEKFNKIEKEFSSTRHKISMNFDDKIKGIEKRLMKKFEDVLEEKLGKILEEKLGNILKA